MTSDVGESLLYKDPARGLRNQQMTAEDGPRFRQGPDRQRPSSRFGEVDREPTYEMCERDRFNAFAGDCVGPYEPGYHLARSAAASGLAERLRSMGVSVRIEQREDRSRAYHVGSRGGVLEEEEFVEMAHALVYDDRRYTAEHVAQLATEYGTWFIANYRIYPYAGDARHKDEPAPDMFRPEDPAAAFAEAGRKAKAFTDPMVKGMGWVTLATSGVGAFVEIGAAASFVVRGLVPLVTPLLFSAEARPGALTAADLQAMAKGIGRLDEVNRFFNSQRPGVPLVVRELVREIARRGVARYGSSD